MFPMEGTVITPPAAGGAVGRLVDCSQADDRRVIRLVRERRLLYARNNMPVASYYAQVKSLWEEVADEMGWSVAEVRRKWSHIRNSYSRHLRNEMGGARTGRGRAVSRWYLADDLEFLREHMATDTRTNTFSSTMPTMVPYSTAECSPPDVKPVPPWCPVDIKIELEEVSQASHTSTLQNDSFAPHETESYFQFFRGIHDDYRSLPERKQRQFRRQCLELLHRMLDEEEDHVSMVAPSTPTDAILPDD